MPATEVDLRGQIVRAWYEAVPGTDTVPTPRELVEAGELLDQWGEHDVLAALPILVQMMLKRFPTAMRWGAAGYYWPLAIREAKARQEQAQRSAQRQAAERESGRTHEDQVRQEAAIYDTWFPVWQELTDGERTEIEKTVLGNHPFARNLPSFMMQLCLTELSKRNVSPGSDSAPTQET